MGGGYLQRERPSSFPTLFLAPVYGKRTRRHARCRKAAHRLQKKCTAILVVGNYIAGSSSVMGSFPSFQGAISPSLTTPYNTLDVNGKEIFEARQTLYKRLLHCVEIWKNGSSCTIRRDRSLNGRAPLVISTVPNADSCQTTIRRSQYLKKIFRQDHDFRIDSLDISFAGASDVDSKASSFMNLHCILVVGLTGNGSIVLIVGGKKLSPSLGAFEGLCGVVHTLRNTMRHKAPNLVHHRLVGLRYFTAEFADPSQVLFGDCNNPSKNQRLLIIRAFRSYSAATLHAHKIQKDTDKLGLGVTLKKNYSLGHSEATYRKRRRRGCPSLNTPRTGNLRDRLLTSTSASSRVRFSLTEVLLTRRQQSRQFFGACQALLNHIVKQFKQDLAASKTHTANNPIEVKVARWIEELPKETIRNNTLQMMCNMIRNCLLLFPDDPYETHAILDRLRRA